MSRHPALGRRCGDTTAHYGSRLAQALVAIFALMAMHALVPSPANAVTNPDSLTMSSVAGAFSGTRPNRIYAYVAAGESFAAELYRSATVPSGAQVDQVVSIKDSAGTVLWQDTIPASAPTTQRFGPSGLLSGAAGVWTIVQEASDPSIRSTSYRASMAWSMDVVDSRGEPISGRLWFDQGGYGNPGPPRTGLPLSDRAANMTFYAVDSTGFEYQVDFRGYNGVWSSISASKTGPVLPGSTCQPAYYSRASAAEIAAGYPNASSPSENCGLFHLFYEPPADDLPASAPGPAGATWVRPPVMDGDSIVRETPVLSPTAWGSTAGPITFSLDPRFQGAYSLRFDANEDGDVDDIEDRTINLAALGGSANSSIVYEFDGLDGEGHPLAPAALAHSSLIFDHLGEIHIALDDVEEFGGGLSITKLNGPGAGDSTVYWDDTQMSATSCFQNRPCASVPDLLDATEGVDSRLGVHGWTGALATGGTTAGWGDSRIIDTWAYGSDDVAVALSYPKGPYRLNKSSVPADRQWVDVGSVIAYSVSASSVEGWTAEGVTLSDDLSDVLDDAEFVQGSARLHVGSEPAVAVADPVDNVLSAHVGDLEPGVTATLTYEVTVRTDAWGVSLTNVVKGTNAAGTPPINCGASAGDDPDPCTTAHQTATGTVYIDKIGQADTGEWVPMAGSAWEVLAGGGEFGEGATPAGGVTTTAVPGAAGVFQVSGLRPGAYWLRETSAPSGFALLAAPLRFFANSDGTITLTESDVTGEIAAVVQVGAEEATSVMPAGTHLRVRDVPSVTLPATGGTTKTWVYSLAGFGILATALLLVVRVRNERRVVRACSRAEVS